MVDEHQHEPLHVVKRQVQDVMVGILRHWHARELRKQHELGQYFSRFHLAILKSIESTSLLEIPRQVSDDFDEFDLAQVQIFEHALRHFVLVGIVVVQEQVKFDSSHSFDLFCDSDWLGKLQSKVCHHKFDHDVVQVVVVVAKQIFQLQEQLRCIVHVTIDVVQIPLEEVIQEG